MFHIFYFLQPDTISRNVNFISGMFNAVSGEKCCLILVPFLLIYNDVRTVKIFLLPES